MTTYDAFVSYSHAGDGRLAPRLQSGLERFARPWWKRRVLRVFRDETGLSASPHLWTSIVDALNDSAWFILLASPEAADSTWVGREIEHWVTHRDVNRMLIVITDGTFVWDEATSDIDWDRSSAAHPRLRGVFESEPRHLDMTWARAELSLDRRHGRFQDALAELAAPLRGIPKDDLAGEDVRQHRRAMRLARAAGGALALLTAGALVTGALAVSQRNEARQQRAEAEAQRERADAEAVTATARGAAANATAQAPSNVDRALLLGAAGVALEVSDETVFGLLESLDSASGLVKFHHGAGDVTAMAVNQQQDQVATVTAAGAVETWTYPDMTALVRTTDHASTAPYAISYVDGGRLIALATETGLSLLDAATLRRVGEPLTVRAPLDPPLVVADISNDGATVVLGQLGAGGVEVRSVATGAVTASFTVPEDLCFGGVRGLDLHEGTNRVAVVCETVIALYDAETGALLHHRPSFQSNGPLFSPDGRVLAVSHISNLVLVLDAGTFEVIERIETPGSRPYAMAYSEVGGLLAVGTDSGDVAVYSLDPDVTTFDPANPEAFGRFEGATRRWGFGGLDGGVLSVSFLASQGNSPARLLVAGPAGLSEWDAAAVPSIATERFRVSPDTLGYALRDASRGELYRPSPVPGASPDSTVFEVLGLSGEVRRTFELAGQDVQLLDLHPTSGRLAATGVSQWPLQDPAAPGLVAPSRLDVQIIDATTGVVLTTFDVSAGIEIDDFSAAQYSTNPEFFTEGRYYVGVIAQWSPDGTLLMVQAGNRTSVWDVAHGTPIAAGSIPLGFGFDWTPDGTMVLNGGLTGDLSLYRVADLSLVKTASLETGYTISDVRRAPVANQMLVTVESGNVYLVDVPSLTPAGDPFAASGIQLQDSDMSPDGQYVASIDRNGDLYLWRTTERARIGPPLSITGLPAFSFEIEFTPRGVVVDEPGAGISLIPIDPAVWAGRACDLAGRELTAAEWTTYVGERPQTPCQ